MSPRDEGLMMRSSVMRWRYLKENLLLTTQGLRLMVFSGQNQSLIPARVLTFLFQTIAWLIAHTPELLLRPSSATLGVTPNYGLP